MWLEDTIKDGQKQFSSCDREKMLLGIEKRPSTRWSIDLKRSKQIGYRWHRTEKYEKN